MLTNDFDDRKHIGEVTFRYETELEAVSFHQRVKGGGENGREFETSGALSICLEKPVIPVGNQMERAFPLEIFRKKRNTFRGIPLFPQERPVFPNKWKAPGSYVRR